MTIIQQGTSSYGRCWIEDHGSYFIVVTMNGQSRSGAFSSFADAMAYYSRFCPN